jgi:uncharacterized protein YceK
MRHTNVVFISLLMVSALCLSGCATYRTLSRFDADRPKIYSGTRLDWNAAFGRGSLVKKFGVEQPPYPILDLPFSFVLDTVMLPATTSAEIFY